MKGKGTLTIEIIQKINQVKILISDTVKASQKISSIFEPGFTTKKELGSGLSLSKGLQRTIIKEK